MYQVYLSYKYSIFTQFAFVKSPAEFFTKKNGSPVGLAERVKKV